MAEIQTLSDWNARMGCCCHMPACPVPVTASQTIPVMICGFAMPEFENMTAVQRDARYEELHISSVYNEVGSYIETEFSFGSKVRSNTTKNHDYRTSFKKEFDDDGDCATIKISSSHNGLNREATSISYPESSTFVDNSNTIVESWSASGGKNEPANGTRTYSNTGVNEYGESNPVNLTNPYIYYGLLETEFINDAVFQGGSTFLIRTTTRSGGTEDGTTNTVETTSTKTRTYKKPINLLALLATKKFPEDALSTGLLYSEFLSFSGKRSRFQFTIPSEHLGTFFKISWDYLEEPEGWNATIPDPAYTGAGTPPQIPKPGRPKRTLKAGMTWTWKGPGKQSDPNGDSWKSPWFEIPIPTFKGRIKAVNFRFECYHGPYGSKPQTMGEVFDD